MDNDKKNSLQGKLRKAFNTAVLVGATLIAGLSPLAAQAQTYGGQQGVQVTQTQQYEQQKPWANDPDYRQAVDNIQMQSDLRMRTYIEQERIRESQLNDRNAQNINRQVQQGKRTGQGGWTGTEILTTISRAGATSQAYTSQLKILRMQLQQRALYEQQATQKKIEAIDLKYSRMPQYKAVQYAPVSQRAATTQAADEIYKSPEEMRAQMIKDYQTAVIAAAKAGKPAPSPERFHLDKDDPAIKIPTGPGQR